MSLPVKESSDELNPAVVVSPADVPPRARTHSPLDYAALAIATFGVGYLPLIPGTFGSLVGVAIFLLLRVWPVQVLFIAVIVVLGVWAASRTERLLGLKDPGKVVVDEVAGQMISLLPLSFLADGPWFVWVIVSFNLFRLFDIFKPYPAHRFEALPGGFGIMADDLVAGLYGAIGTAIVITVFGS
ncbi:MAG TPA: phosphatidylglycerophosphatase A [Pyrinomonadaceae bacterium]|nr:phosphatidylglycerophosphatase A [Pyrinomonadaceae bacterium]